MIEQYNWVRRCRSLLQLLSLAFCITLFSCKTSERLVSDEKARYSKENISKGLNDLIWERGDQFPLLDQEEYLAVYSHFQYINRRVSESKREKKFWVINTDEIHAWILPDGTTYWTKGFLKALKSDEELATALAILEADRNTDGHWEAMQEQTEKAIIEKCSNNPTACDVRVLYNYIYSALPEDAVEMTDSIAAELLCTSDFQGDAESLKRSLRLDGSLWMTIYPKFGDFKNTTDCESSSAADRYPYVMKLLEKEKLKVINSDNTGDSHILELEKRAMPPRLSKENN